MEAAAAENVSEGGSESPNSSRFKVTVSPPASNSPIGSAKLNHVAKAASNSPAASNNKTPEHVENGVPEAEEVDDELPGPMQPREAIVRSVPSIELPDGKINSSKLSNILGTCQVSKTLRSARANSASRR